jgi:hypothetical protein
MIVDQGGLQAAKILLSANNPQYGFTELWLCGRLDLTVEALILKAEFSKLFTNQKLAVAEKRLKDHGYNLLGRSN